jgi:hypothetical protein
MHYQKPYTLLYFFILLFILAGTEAKSQNVTSPYSILGIGDIDTKDYGRYFITGSSSIARRDVLSYNFSNPASLTSLPYKMMNFDISMRGRVSTFNDPSTDSTTAPTKDFAIKKITMAFKVTQKIGIAFGLRPYSSLSTQQQTSTAILNGNSFLITSTDGSGGINQAYFSLGKSLGRNPDSSKVSIGFTASYLFGSLQQTSTYSGTSLLFSIVQQQTNFLYGANLQGGIQFSSFRPADKVQKQWKHHLGLTATVSTPLNGQLTTDYTDNSNPNVPPIPETVSSTQFKLPVSVGFGYSATSNNALTLSCDVNYSKWPYQQLNFSNSYTTNSLRVSGGLEYSKKIKYSAGVIEKYFFGIGFSGENSYQMINNNYLRDYALSFGGGYNFSQRLSFYGGIEVGTKGSLAAQQIKENYTGFSLGLTLKDLWYGTKKFGKFY